MSRVFVRCSMLAVVTLCVWGVWTALAAAQSAGGQGQSANASNSQKAPPAPTRDLAGKPAAKAFYAEYDKWKNMLKKLGELTTKYNSAKEGPETEAIRKEWDATIATGEKLLPQLRAAALKAYEESPNEDRQLTRLLVALTADALAQDQYEITRDTAEILIKHECPDRKVWDFAGVAAFSLHDFAKAKQFLTQAKESNVISEKSTNFLDETDAYIDLWKKEQEIRKQQTDKNLPQVRFTTTKGEIVIELFEDDAPDTVANFITLVESDFYDGLTFHRVLDGFMAQTGCPKGDGSGGPGYNIFDECDPEKYPNYRRHFRGTLSMANAGRPNTGGSQFFLTFRPTPNLNGKHTVFGRIIKGLEILEQLERINPDAPDPRLTPDKIINAEVIRKRDHEYVVNKVK